MHIASNHSRAFFFLSASGYLGRNEFRNIPLIPKQNHPGLQHQTSDVRRPKNHHSAFGCFTRSICRQYLQGLSLLILLSPSCLFWHTDTANGGTPAQFYVEVHGPPAVGTWRTKEDFYGKSLKWQNKPPAHQTTFWAQSIFGNKKVKCLELTVSGQSMPVTPSSSPGNGSGRACSKACQQKERHCAAY